MLFFQWRDGKERAGPPAEPRVHLALPVAGWHGEPALSLPATKRKHEGGSPSTRSHGQKEEQRTESETYSSRLRSGTRSASNCIFRLSSLFLPSGRVTHDLKDKRKKPCARTNHRESEKDSLSRWLSRCQGLSFLFPVVRNERVRRSTAKDYLSDRQAWTQGLRNAVFSLSQTLWSCLGWSKRESLAVDPVPRVEKEQTVGIRTRQSAFLSHSWRRDQSLMGYSQPTEPAPINDWPPSLGPSPNLRYGWISTLRSTVWLEIHPDLRFGGPSQA